MAYSTGPNRFGPSGIVPHSARVAYMVGTWVMREIIRSNDPVLMSFAAALLRDAGVESMLADQNMSILEGSVGILPQRMLVASDDWAQAARVLRDAELGLWVAE